MQVPRVNRAALPVLPEASEKPELADPRVFPEKQVCSRGECLMVIGFIMGVWCLIVIVVVITVQSLSHILMGYNIT